ncbi:MAG: hypothetical protein GXY09_02390 [Bacteroidales bacterium]|nr:hypothetical protein [Bacteroidales bacterium]
MEQIKSQLCSLRLSGMASCWQMLEETRRTPELSLKDGMELLLQAESDQRNVNRYAKLLRNAGFRYKGYWRTAKSPILQRSICSDSLNRSGYIFLSDCYRSCQ